MGRALLIRRPEWPVLALLPRAPHRLVVDLAAEVVLLLVLRHAAAVPVDASPKRGAAGATRALP